MGKWGRGEVRRREERKQTGVKWKPPFGET